MGMREGPLEILDRTRDIFLTSLGDSIGKADAGAEFYYAALSAERKGYFLNSRDQGLLKMFYSVMKQNDYGWEKSEDMGGFRTHIDPEREAEEGMMATTAGIDAGMGEQSIRTYLGHQAGQQLSNNPSYDENRIVPAVNPEMPNDGLSGKHVEMVDGETDDYYRTHNYFDKRFNPVAGRMHHIVGDFYLPSDEYAESQSKIDADKELLWEQHHMEGPQVFLRGATHYGKINDDGTNHALYEKDYGHWESDDKAQQIRLALEEQGKSEEEIEYELRKMHIADKKVEWKDNLGFFDYMFGMEWLTPEQRNEAYRYMIQHGLSNDNQHLRFNTHSIDWAPRLKRNFQQRFMGMYNHWTRPPQHLGEAIKNRPIRLPEKTEHITRQTNLHTMRNNQTVGHPSHMERGLVYLANKMGYEITADMLSRVPYIQQDSEGQEVLDFHDRSKGEQRGLSWRALQEMLNIDGDGNLLDNEGPFSQEEVRDILARRKVSATQNEGAGRLARNSAIMHYGAFVDPEYYSHFFTDAQREAGDNTTMSTYWQRPFFKGGMGKQANDLFNLLHHHSLIPQSLLESLGQVESEQEPEEEDFDPYSDEAMQQMLEARDAGPENQLEEEPVVEDKVLQSDRSLLFDRTPNGIAIHHDFDKDGHIRDGKMLPALAPMGQPTHELSRMISGNGGTMRDITVPFVGDVTDAESNLNPHGVFYSTRLKGVSGKRNVARNMLSHDPKYHNEILEAYHKARESGDRDKAQAMRHILRGAKGNTLPTVHPNMHRGSVYDNKRSLRLNSHAGHSIGTLVGMGNPNPAATIDDLHPHHTVYEREDLERLKSIEKEPQRLDLLIADMEKKLADTPDEYVTTKKRLQLQLEELQRQAKTFRNEPLTPHAPTTSRYDEHGEQTYFDSPNVLSLNPPGQVSMLGVQEEHMDHDIEEQYVNLIEKRGNLEAELNSSETSKERKSEIRSELAQNNIELEELERRMPVATEDVFAGKESHVPEMTRQRLKADTDAIAQAGAHLRRMMGSDYDDLFSPDLPLETIEANIRMLARMANDYLHTVPHDNHGIHTLGMGEHGEEKVMAGADTSYNVKEIVHNSPLRVGLSQLQDKEQLASDLGLDINQPHVKANLDDFLKNIFYPKFMSIEGESEKVNFSMPVMTVGQYMKASGMVDSDMDFEEEIRLLGGRFKDRNVELAKRVRELSNQLRPQDRAGLEGTQQLNDKLGFNFHLSHNPDPKYEGSKKLSPSRGTKDDKRKSEAYRTQQILDSIIFSDPDIEPQMQTSVEAIRRGLGRVPIDTFGPDSHTVHSLYNSAGFQHEFGEEYHPTFDYHIHHNGDVEVVRRPKGMAMRLVSPMQSFWDATVPHLRDPEGVDLLHPDYLHHNGAHRSSLHTEDRKAAQFKMNEIGETRNQDRHSFGKSEIGLADLTNPDIIRKELGKEVPLLQPMHRIFELDDLEHLRGFTGDWIVSVMPEGERGFVKKEDDEVSSKPFSLSKEDKENFKKVSSDDFHVAVIKLEDGYYIFDVIEFDGNEVHDTLLDDRIKILRGGMEGVENIHVPSASDTRLTDDAGLELIVEDLQKEHEKLLLRDAKSVYMVGELRHPKWVMLSPGNDVVLRVLERRGNGPYTYRLGTGPITQEDNLGDRAVESGGDTYMDVGAAFDSSEKFNEGDHVRVNVANVGEMETTGGQKIYTVSGSDIQEEAEGEGLVSQETLGMLAKSDSAQWLCEVSRASSGVRVMMPQGDVVYKCTQSGRLWTVHSPLAANSYLIRLAESQRQYWSPVAGALLKANLEIKEEVHENGGFGSDSVEPAEPLVKPKKVKGTDWWDDEKKKVLVKGLQLVEKLLKSGAGAVGQSSTGAMGLGIDYATPIESPTGPTNLNNSKTMPDFDNRKRPGEDFSIEPETEDSEPAKHITIPVEEGVLEITEDSAVLRT